MKHTNGAKGFFLYVSTAVEIGHAGHAQAIVCGAQTVMELALNAQGLFTNLSARMQWKYAYARVNRGQQRRRQKSVDALTYTCMAHTHTHMHIYMPSVYKHTLSQSSFSSASAVWSLARHCSSFLRRDRSSQPFSQSIQRTQFLSFFPSFISSPSPFYIYIYTHTLTHSHRHTLLPLPNHIFFSPPNK